MSSPAVRFACLSLSLSVRPECFARALFTCIRCTYTNKGTVPACTPCGKLSPLALGRVVARRPVTIICWPIFSGNWPPCSCGSRDHMYSKLCLYVFLSVFVFVCLWFVLFCWFSKVFVFVCFCVCLCEHVFIYLRETVALGGLSRCCWVVTRCFKPQTKSASIVDSFRWICSKHKPRIVIGTRIQWIETNSRLSYQGTLRYLHLRI